MMQMPTERLLAIGRVTVNSIKKLANLLKDDRKKKDIDDFDNHSHETSQICHLLRMWNSQ